MTIAAAKPVILAVDDAPDSLSLLTDILENAGMTALVALSGRSALTLLGHAIPDLILMDAVMPKMDGFETCIEIKKHDHFRHIPLIFMTGLTDTEHVVKGLEAGGIDYITKPVIPDELLARIRVHLANSRLAQSARMALDFSGSPLAAVDSNGKTLWMTPQSNRLFRLASPENGEAPQDVTEIFAQIVAEKSINTPVHRSETGTVVASFIGESRPGEYLIRFREEGSSSEDEILRKHFNLTAREAEVLLWIGQGKSNRDVAEILICKPRTVNKHLEQIYHKLNVENRTAAAMLAVRVLTDASA